ncbi:MAG: pyridoxal-phosphate dependent enzyme, partial [Spirochaetales bacterium]|nr:pyridoxal-phosphate dependent enzyme [Spirochaetales bacterium]
MGLCLGSPGYGGFQERKDPQREEKDSPPGKGGSEFPLRRKGGIAVIFLDNARGQANSVLGEIQVLAAQVQDPALSTAQRAEAYGDIIASEVGDSLLSRARNLEREYGFRQLYLKFEGTNPSGTQKDRIAFAQVEDAFRQGYDRIVFATCGNYGASLSFAASLAGLACL